VNRRTAPRAALLDADGVMQTNPDGWQDDLAAMVPEGRGEEFVADMFASERPAMAGDRAFQTVVREVAARWGLTDRLGELLAHWWRIEVVPGTVSVVRDLRAQGLRCFLATYQHDHRAAYMRGTLGYDDLFDGQFYSCELGVMKPDPHFFTKVLAAVDLPAEAVLLVDDNEEYVEAAGRLGLQAELWSVGDGADLLRRRLAARGLPV
jgi:putative hydrolase of the HAD superfamily